MASLQVYIRDPMQTENKRQQWWPTEQGRDESREAFGDVNQVPLQMSAARIGPAQAETLRSKLAGSPTVQGFSAIPKDRYATTKTALYVSADTGKSWQASRLLEPAIQGPSGRRERSAARYTAEGHVRFL